MIRLTISKAPIALLCIYIILSPVNRCAATNEKADIENVVARAIRPAMERYGIPGMAVGIVAGGQTYVFDYGVASKTTGRPVTSDTLFEIGSISKTFTATLASYARVSGKLLLTDAASKYLPSLRGSSFDNVSLLNLGTHTSGGLPLQVPTEIASDAELMAYLQRWKPASTPGTSRTYSNVSIGLLGMITARSMNGDFAALMQDDLFAGLGLKNTYLDVPNAQAENYAEGYTTRGDPIRMTPGVLAPEAYGIRSTAGDMVRFALANMGMLDINAALQRAIIDTHTGAYRIEGMTQDLIWEQYPYPVELKTLLAGNSAKISGQANPVIPVDPPLAPEDDVLINKTGSTNGFAAYIAFVPRIKTGVILLANKNYPIDARVTEAYEVLTALEGGAAKGKNLAADGNADDQK